ncbi:MAG: GSCFA domain-containing protein [Odoribacteraceae bacterium]|jgi:hypothetical protein|nr:GSCFA domain-containing protein [Odoribacteraceae bacterium]
MTKVGVPAPGFSVDYRSRFLFIGSCFAESIAARLLYHGFDAEVNPRGILYNPCSVADALEALVERRRASERDLMQVNGKWVSLLHHGSFSDHDPVACLEKINTRAERAADALREVDLLAITWGTAWVYKHRGEGIVVANCHKIPDREFERYRLDVAAIVRRYEPLVRSIREINPRARLLFTVSPVRHLRDGARGNHLGKAILLLAIERLQALFPDALYFPAYEILLDELRDYRFYADDMCHPSAVAVEYIWEAFKNAYISPACYPVARQVEAIRRRMDHRSSTPDPLLRHQLERQLEALVAPFKKNP